MIPVAEAVCLIGIGLAAIGVGLMMLALGLAILKSVIE